MERSSRLLYCYHYDLGLAVVDLVKDPNPAGSLTRSATLKSSCHRPLVPQPGIVTSRTDGLSFGALLYAPGFTASRLHARGYDHLF